MYFKTREKIFIAAFTLGVPLAGIWFIYRNTETYNYFDIAFLHYVAVFLCILVSLLPSFVLYAFLYLINGLLISAGAPRELRLRQEQIAEALVRATISKATLPKASRDLVDELAWATLKQFWSGA